MEDVRLQTLEQDMIITMLQLLFQQHLTLGEEYLPSTNINASLRFPEYGSRKLNLKFQQSFRNAALSISVGLNQSPDILLSAAIATSSIACGIESKYKTAFDCFTRYGAGISIINPSHDASIILCLLT